MTGLKSWQPTASRDILVKRSELLKLLRRFMDERSILEVDTPVLNTAAITDPNIESLKTTVKLPGSNQAGNYYLQTSPEFFMKRLLAHDSGDIYQITKVFRDGEVGQMHQPEFTMLEWYRTGYNHHDLMDELDEMLDMLGLAKSDRTTYSDTFRDKTGLDPLQTETGTLQDWARHSGLSMHEPDRDTLLDYIFSHCITPEIGFDRPVMIADYPPGQASLATLTSAEPRVAERFELFINGTEIANGFNELRDYSEQKSRFENDNQKRIKAGLSEVTIDTNLLDALENGIPHCAGVAVGIDRLLMVLTGSDNISEVMTFPLSV